MTQNKENSTNNDFSSPVIGDSHLTEETTMPTRQAGRYEDMNFVDSSGPVWNYSILYDDDVQTFQQGTHYSLYNKFGSKPMTVLGREGYLFSVWAPNATEVSVIGNFNDWKPGLHPLRPR